MLLISRGPYHLGPLLQLPDVTGVPTNKWELGAYTLREKHEFLFGKSGAMLVLDSFRSHDFYSWSMVIFFNAVVDSMRNKALGVKTTLADCSGRAANKHEDS